MQASIAEAEQVVHSKDGIANEYNTMNDSGSSAATSGEKKNKKNNTNCTSNANTLGIEEGDDNEFIRGTAATAKAKTTNQPSPSPSPLKGVLSPLRKVNHFVKYHYEEQRLLEKKLILNRWFKRKRRKNPTNIDESGNNRDKINHIDNKMNNNNETEETAQHRSQNQQEQKQQKEDGEQEGQEQKAVEETKEVVLAKEAQSAIVEKPWIKYNDTNHHSTSISTEGDYDDSNGNNDYPLVDHKKKICLLFFFDPFQQHSLRLRSILAHLCSEYSNDVYCIAFCNNSQQYGYYDFDMTNNETDYKENDATSAFFHGTGFHRVVPSLSVSSSNDNDDSTTNINIEDEKINNLIYYNREKEDHIARSLLRLCNVTKIPTLVVVPPVTSRPLLEEEVAVEWNEQDFSSLIRRWRDGCSGSSLSQQIASIPATKCVIT